MSFPPPSHPQPYRPFYGPGFPPPPPSPGRPSRVGFAVAAGLLLVAAVAVTGLLFFGMIFASDSCGTSAGTARFCDDSGAWMLAMFGPTVALAAAVVTVVLGVVWARRPWTSLALGVLVYATGPALALFTVFG